MTTLTEVNQARLAHSKDALSRKEFEDFADKHKEVDGNGLLHLAVGAVHVGDVLLTESEADALKAAEEGGE